MKYSIILIVVRLNSGKIKKFYLIFVGLGLLFVSITNFPKTEFNFLDIIIELTILLGKYTGKILAVAYPYTMVTLFFSPELLYEDHRDFLKKSVTFFISGGLLLISLTGAIKGLGHLIILYYVLYYVLTSAKIGSQELSREIFLGFPYLIFIPSAVYLFGISGAIIGCLFLCIVNFFILYMNLFSSKKSYKEGSLKISKITIKRVLTGETVAGEAIKVICDQNNKVVEIICRGSGEVVKISEKWSELTTETGKIILTGETIAGEAIKVICDQNKNILRIIYKDHRKVIKIIEKCGEWTTDASIFVPLPSLMNIVDNFELPRPIIFFIYSLPYLILVPIFTFFSDVIGTLTCCIVIYLIYILCDVRFNGQLPETNLHKFSGVAPHDY